MGRSVPLKNRLSIVLVLVCLLVVAPLAQAAGTKVISVYPTSFLAGVIAGEYEWATDIDRSYAIQVSALGASTTDVSVSGLAGGLSLRKYVEGTALDGLYLGGAATVAYVNAKDAYESASAAVVALGGRAGYKLTLGASLVLDLAATVTVPVFASASIGDESGSAFGIGQLGAGFSVGLGYKW